MNRGDMTKDEFMDRSEARAAGAVAGLAIVATAVAGIEVAAALGVTSAKVGPRGVARANKIKHIFGQVRHNLGDLSKAMGGDVKAFRAIEKATKRAVDVSNEGRFETVVKVGREQVTVRGSVVDGQVKIGTAFVKPQPQAPLP